ncbi:methyl-accepting chemotaxis protein [Caenispirillum bisanense]|uniref:methyl-accepting chemotaxis protein n=1 Tax=Caenispirillum bisanense TaxID=414052 RepID=UPI000BE37842|nr:methyl-accepting chemotaxis protein [Caenispirillum bisanense]
MTSFGEPPAVAGAVAGPHSSADALEADLVAAGWVSPQRVEELERVIGLIATAQYAAVPAGKDALGRALRELARSIGRQASTRLHSCVDLSIRSNSNLETAVAIFGDVRQIGSRSQAIAAAAEELVSSVETIAQNSGAVADEARAALAEARDGRAQAQRATECMERIAGSVLTAARQVDRLGEAAENIGHIVLTIEEIAFHTNMIALNAAVEAARAGEAGKGFMVVADEVKRLARQTKEATVDISQRIGTLRTDMATIVESMQSVDMVVAEGRDAIAETGGRVEVIAGGVREVAERIAEVADIINQQQVAASDVAHGITVVAGEADHIRERVGGVLDVLDGIDGIVVKELEVLAGMDLPLKVIHLAKADHVRWKKNIVAMLAGRKTLDAASLSDHHGCRLGKWYDAVTDARILAAPAFAALEAPHRAVHAAGREAVRQHAEGDHDGALRSLAEVTRASQDVLALLDRLRGEVRAPAVAAAG